MTDAAHSGRAHAKLSPSGASRWKNCPGSILMESSVGDSSSDAANEGTAAHELAAWCLEDVSRSPDHMLGRVIDITADTTALRFLMGGAPHEGDTNRWPVTDEMVESVETYVDYVRSRAGELTIEERLDMTHVHPDCWGTGDALVYDPAEQHLYVIDLKYGRGVLVEVEENNQLSLYGSGAAKRFHNRGVKTISLVIIQPRAVHEDGPIRSETITAAELSARERKLQNAAMEVDRARTQLPTMVHGDWLKEFVFAGDWCRFCKVGATCPVRAQQAMEDAAAEFEPITQSADLSAVTTLSPDALGRLLGKARQIQHWIKAVEEHAHAEATEGRMPDGFKLVATRATRKWTDEETLKIMAPVLFGDLSPEDLYAEPKLRSPAQLEKLLPKERRGELSKFVTKKSSGTNLVPVDDKRTDAKPSATSEFASTET